MLSFRDWPIERKLVWVTMLVVGITLVANAVAMTVLDVIAFRAKALDDEVTMAELLATNAIPALEFNDQSAARDTLATLRARPDIVAGAIYSTSGELFASYTREPRTNSLPRQPKPGYRFANRFVELTLPITDQERRVGLIYLRTDLAAIYERLDWGMLMRGLFLAGALVLALIATRFSQRFISGPILQLARTAREVAAKKDYTLRVVRRGGGEVGQLTDDFNG